MIIYQFNKQSLTKYSAEGQLKLKKEKDFAILYLIYRKLYTQLGNCCTADCHGDNVGELIAERWLDNTHTYIVSLRLQCSF